MAKYSDVQFKYVLSKPTTAVEKGAFYWIWEEHKSQLYFSPSEDPADLLRLDNILGSSSNVGANIVYLAGIPSVTDAKSITKEDFETITVDSVVRPRTDEEFANFIKKYADSTIYGEISKLPYSAGCVIICGGREFICETSSITYVTMSDSSDSDSEGTLYYKSKETGKPCVDENGDKIVYSPTGTAPTDAEVSKVDTTWELFGKSLSDDLVKQFKAHTTIKLANNSNKHLTLTEKDDSDGNIEYTIGLKSQTIEGEDKLETTNEYVDVAVTAVDDSDGDYKLYTTVNANTLSVEDADSDHDGLATANDVRQYVDKNKFELYWDDGKSE